MSLQRKFRFNEAGSPAMRTQRERAQEALNTRAGVPPLSAGDEETPETIAYKKRCAKLYAMVPSAGVHEDKPHFTREFTYASSSLAAPVVFSTAALLAAMAGIKLSKL